jgi:hypothetical protein
MTHSSVRALRSIGLVAATVVAGFTACGDSQGLFLSDGVKLQTGSTCDLVEADIQGLPVLSRGVMDLAITNQYRLLLRYRNRSGDDQSLRTATLHLDLGKFTPAAKATLPGLPADKASSLALGYKYATEGVQIPVSGGVLPNEWGVVEIPILPEEVGTLLATKMMKLVETYSASNAPEVVVVATLTIHAMASGSGSNASNEFSFPVELCWGCLMAPDAQPRASACRPGQDDVTDQATCPLVAVHPESCQVSLPDGPDAQGGELPMEDLPGGDTADS